MTSTFLNLAWLVPLPPLLAFFAIILFTNKSKRLSSNVAIGAIVIAWALAWLVAFAFFLQPELIEHPFDVAVPWLPTGATLFSMGVAVDAATAGMLFMVGFVLAMIFIYSSGYMTFPGHLAAALNRMAWTRVTAGSLPTSPSLPPACWGWWWPTTCSCSSSSGRSWGCVPIC